jgi:hypothetical protein
VPYPAIKIDRAAKIGVSINDNRKGGEKANEKKDLHPAEDRRERGGSPLLIE